MKESIVYMTVMGTPDANIESINFSRKNTRDHINKIELLGSSEKIKWKQNKDCLLIEKPQSIPNNIAIVFKIYTNYAGPQ